MNYAVALYSINLGSVAVRHHDSKPVTCKPHCYNAFDPTNIISLSLLLFCITRKGMNTSTPEYVLK